MEVFENLGIKIPAAVLVKGDPEDIEEVIDFLKQYGSINRAEAIDESSSEFHQNWIVEYNSGTALAALEPLLPYTYVSEDGENTYCISCLANAYAEKVGNKKTQSYLADLKLLAKVSGKNYAEVLKDMMLQIGESITDLEPAVSNGTELPEETSEVGVLKTSPQPPLKVSPAGAAYPAGTVTKSLPRAQSAGMKTNPTIATCDINPPEVQRYVVEHIVKSEDNSMHMLSSQRLRVFSGKVPRPPQEADYDTWRSSVDLLMKDPAVSDLQRSRKLLESLLPPAADMVKHLSPDTLPAVYLQQLDSAFGTVQDGDELYAKFMDTFQDAGEKPSAYLQRLQVALNLTVKRGGIPGAEVSKHLLNQFCRGCWDNSLITELQLKQKKAKPPSFAELLLLLRTEEDRGAAKTMRMKQHLGAAKQKVSSYRQVAYSDEEKGVCAVLTTLTQQLTKQMAEIQSQLAALTANQQKVKTSFPPKSAYPNKQFERQKSEKFVKQPVQFLQKKTTPRPKPGYCFQCGEDGHIKPQCDDEPNPALVTEKRKQFNEKCHKWEKQNPSAATEHLN